MDDESALVMRAEAACKDAVFAGECVRRVPELAGHPDFREWGDWIEELDEMDGDDICRDLAECQEYTNGAGWIEEEDGGTGFIPYW